MSDAQTEWLQEPLRELVDPNRKITYGIVQPGEWQEMGKGVALIRGQDYSSGEVKVESLRYVHPSIAAAYTRSTVKPGDILFSIVGYVGLCAEVPSEVDGANITQTTARIAPRLGIDGRFLLHYFRSNPFQEEVKKYTKGSAQPGLNLADVEKMVVYYPDAESEQTKIALVLDTLDTQIRQTEALITKLERIKQGLLTDLLTRGIDQNGQLRPPPDQAPHLYKDSPLGRIPREWTVDPLGTLSEIVSGVTLGGTPPGLSARLVPYLRVANVQDGFLDLSEIKYIRVTASDAEKFRLREGDVLMNEGGDYDKLGRGTVWRNEVDGCIHQNHVFRVRPDQSALLPDYLAAYSASPGGKAYFLRASKQSTNLASINSTQLKAFPIPLAPVHEQQAINSTLSGVNARIDQEGASLRKLLTHKSGLMDDLLTGRVRVTPLLDAAKQAHG